MDTYKIHVYRAEDYHEALSFILQWLNENFPNCYDYTEEDQTLTAVIPLCLQFLKVYNRNWEEAGYLYLVDYV